MGSTLGLVEAVIQVQLAMLKAAVAVAQRGAEELKQEKFKDPFGSGPFTYTIHFENLADVALDAFVVRDLLPGFVVLKRVDAPGFRMTQAPLPCGTLLTFTRDEGLAPGDSGSISITVALVGTSLR